MGLFIVKRISEMYYRGSLELRNHAIGGCHASLTLMHAGADDVDAENVDAKNVDAKNAGPKNDKSEQTL